MSEERPRPPFIADGVEAALAVGWIVIFVAGVFLAAFVSPLFYMVIAFGVAIDWVMLRQRVARRLNLGPRDRRVLWLWTGRRGTYHAIRYIAGRRGP